MSYSIILIPKSRTILEKESNSTSSTLINVSTSGREEVMYNMLINHIKLNDPLSIVRTLRLMYNKTFNINLNVSKIEIIDNTILICQW